MSIKNRIAFSRLLKKDTDSKFKSRYVEFYLSRNSGDILILILKPYLQIESNEIEEYIKEVIEPITGEIIYSFMEKKYLGAFDKRGNMGFTKDDDIYTVLDINKIIKGFSMPETIDSNYIYGLYELIERVIIAKGKTDKRKAYSKDFKY